MEQSPWEANSRSPSQEILCFYGIWKLFWTE
jgi:hypothetical protein